MTGLACIDSETPEAAGAQGREHPELWALRLLLEASGTALDETLLFGLCGGAGFAFDPAAPSSLTGWDPAQSALATGASHLAMLGALQETARGARAAEQLDAVIAGGASAVVWLDRAALMASAGPASGAAPTADRTANHAPAGGAGLAVVEGAEGELLRVRTRSAAGSSIAVTRDQLAAARGAVPALRHRLLTTCPGEVDLGRAVRGGLAMTAVGGARAKKRDHGPAGIAALAAQVGGGGRKDWARRYATDQQLAAALAALAGAIAREGGLHRGAQAAYERRAAALLAIDQLLAVATDHDRLAAAWQAAARLACEASQSTAPRGALPELAAQLADLAAAEASALERLRATLRAT